MGSADLWWVLILLKPDGAFDRPTADGCPMVLRLSLV
ncbi:hypothetical protein COLO4_08210 [Corchorus olitorius]|uniref:Uncharacterized protein n=1 Tax=Corchorus olitorius TaxID=93759 RepID=A0A1R3KGZ5_9ROSI|nr:hypothetical protein COLO4_08210 [Corchorus olitorius]